MSSPVGRIAVRVTARARSDEVVGERAGVLAVRVKAPPVEGRANDAVRKLLAKRLGVPASRVAVVRGGSSREKLIAVEGLETKALRRALGLGPATSRG
ncbi:MAG TPA: DUF167 domain-containing protein [Solirubrobacterales bacterium]